MNPLSLAASSMPPIFRRLRVGRLRQVVDYLLAIASVALITVLIGWLESSLHLVPNPMLYLIAVLVTATSLGSVPAVVEDNPN